MQPEVSVVVPVFRGEAFLAATIQSLQGQSFSNFEVLFIDDCSDDGSRDVILAHAASDQRLRYVRSETNLGNVPRVLSRYLGHAKGRYFAYSSQDDSFSADWLSSMVEVAKRTGAEAVVPDLVFYDDVRGDYRTIENSNRMPVTGTEAFLLSLDWSIPGNALFQRSLFEQFGFYDFGMYADEYSWRFYFLHCRKVAFAEGVFHYHQGNPDAITRKISVGMLDRVSNDFRLWQLVEEHAPASPWVRRYAQQCFRSLRWALIMLEQHPDLASGEGRVRSGLAEMQTHPSYARHLCESYDNVLLGGLAATGLHHPWLLRLANRAGVLRTKISGA